MSKITDEAFESIKQKRVEIYTCPQIGFMITWGVTFEGRKYFSIDLPFVWIQIFLNK